MKYRWTIHGLAALAIVVFISGCKEEEKYQLQFSHRMHVEEMGMTCADCHGESGEGFNVISHKSCSDCHMEVDAENVAEDTCGICHQEKQLPEFEGVAYVPPAAAGNTGSVFVHTEALKGKCADCHASILDESAKVTPPMDRDDILAIREESHGSGMDCMTCHVDMSIDQAPLSHDLAWERRHGQFGGMQDASCSVCHTEDSCKECHSVMQPLSHNQVFRTRTHGVEAAWDRNSCMVCHEQDSCTSCHANNRPRSHNARWGAPGYRPTHCIGCHNTSTPGDGCVTCHEGGNDIMLHEQYWGGASFDHSALSGESCYICHWTKTP